MLSFRHVLSKYNFFTSNISIIIFLQLLIEIYKTTLLYRKSSLFSPSGLESTSLVFAYGLDLFYTRVTPRYALNALLIGRIIKIYFSIFSGTFDILKDDFDYLLIFGVMLLLVVATVVCKRIWRYQSIQQAWA